MAESIRHISKGQARIIILPNILYLVIVIIAILLTAYLPQIPWQLLPGASLLNPWRFLELLVGTILLLLAIMFIVWGVTSLGRDRTQGGEIGLSRRTSTLVTVGAYSYCRHPQTLGLILMNPALALMFDLVPFLIIAVLFPLLQLALLGYEEFELLGRFGDTYGMYREAVPFIIPRRKRILPKA
ncbi:MAG: methyltransferase family protein [Candidatus Hodarchaeota archaeon]